MCISVNPNKIDVVPLRCPKKGLRRCHPISVGRGPEGSSFTPTARRDTSVPIMIDSMHPQTSYLRIAIKPFGNHETPSIPEYALLLLVAHFNTPIIVRRLK